MDKNASHRIIKDTLESGFDKNRFFIFSKNLLNKIDESKVFQYSGAYIPESFRGYIKSYERLGTYTDPEGKKIDVLIVYLQKEASLERARTAQRNFVARYLKERDEKDAGLVAFVSPNSADWRFSLIKMEYKFSEGKSGKVKVKEEFTPARRWSFLVGANENSHTAKSRLAPIIQDDEHNPTLKVLEEAFNIEKVTQEFFEKYHDLFLRVKKTLDDVIEKDSPIRRDFTEKGVNTVEFAKKLLGQIVFLYFLQKKGWFGVERDADWGSGPKNFLRQLFEKKHGDYKNFFNDILEPLFYEALARERDDDFYSRFDCKIPFLNGGLFDPINNYDWVHIDILLPDDLFSNMRKTKEGDTGDGILDVFDRYNFTVKEDEPLEKEVAVDPETLGKVFENLLEVKDRKSKGTYYTPREIVHYMCVQSLVNYLATELGAKVSKVDLEMLIKYGEMSVEYEALYVEKTERNSEYKGKYNKPQLPISIERNAKIIDEALANIKVCDPAIGSGAFPVGMMTEVVRTRNVLSSYIKSFDRTLYNFKRDCIQNSLYGVDIDPGAVEIAKLRLWLSLVVDEDDIKQIKPLPNLDYKIVCGNSLLGVEKDLFNSHLFSELEHLKPLLFNEINPKKKQEYKNQIDKLIGQITHGHKEFDFEVYFSEVFHERKGFDAVVANPPYIGEKGHKEMFRQIKKGDLGKFYIRKTDLFYFFFHRAIQITKKDGQIAFITTNYYPTATQANKLRNDFYENVTIKNLVNFNELKIFESALGQHNMVTLLQKCRKDSLANNCITHRRGVASQDVLQRILMWEDYETEYYKTTQEDLYDGESKYLRLSGSRLSKNPIDLILEKVKENSTPLGIIFNVNQGILTGVDKVSQKHLIKHPTLEIKKGDGVYVLDLKEVNNINEKSLLKPWFKNSSIRRYFTEVDSAEFVLYLTRDLDITKYNDVHFHILKYEKIIKARPKDRGEMQAALKVGKWWVIFAARKGLSFDGEKIVSPQRSPRNTFGYNAVPWYASADVYYITKRNDDLSLKYALGLLNSKLFYLWLYHRGKRKGETLELYQKPLSEIPIKKISEEEQKPFIGVVDKILAITKDAGYLKNNANQAKIREYEKQIDQMVYELYGLTEGEIKIVEGDSDQEKLRK